MLDLSLQIACSPVTQGLPEENQAAVDPERVRVQWLLSKAPRLDSLDEAWRPFNADGNRIETGMALEAAWAGGVIVLTLLSPYCASSWQSNPAGQPPSRSVGGIGM